MNKRPEVTEATRQRFMDAFSRLYAEKPVEKITVTEIARLAGHNRVTFYQYFKDAYDVLDAMEDEFIGMIRKKMGEILRQGEIPENFAVIFAQVMEENKEAIQLFFSGSNVEHTLRKLREMIREVGTRVFRLKEEDLYARYLLEFYLAGAGSMLVLWIRRGEDLPREELAGIIQRILRDAVLPRLRESGNWA